MQQRDIFASKIGIIAAAAGSAIGLGNLWKFPYMAGKYGGSAFIIIYIIAIILMGYPLIYSEFAIGRKTKVNAADAFGKVVNKKCWNITGILSVISICLITTFYLMITGWVVYYFFQSVTGNLYVVPEGIDASVHFTNIFSSMSASMWIPAILGTVAAIATGFINSLGIKEGIEKYSKILMPILAVLFIGLIAYSTTLSGFKQSVLFLFQPNFTALTPTVVIAAIGQAFFSLSIGMGILVTYGSYISEKEDIRHIAKSVCVADTLIALFAGLLIFPAVFTYNLEPTQGPSLIFMSLPQVFLKMPGGRWFSALFFLFVFIAALTSLVSMLEIPITYLQERTHWNRKKTTWTIVTFSCLASYIITAGEGPLSSIHIFGMTIFGVLDYLTNNITIPLAAVLIAVLVGWVWKTDNLNAELAIGGRGEKFTDKILTFFLKWITPVLIVILMVSLLTGVQP